MKKLDGRVVRFVAVDPKYARVPYPAKPAWSQRMNTWVTGQHIDPEDKSTHKYLTPSEMEHPEKMSATRKATWPYVITPENGVFIHHSRPYNCKVDGKGNPLNPTEYWEAHFIILQDNVADMKSKVRKSKHKFYLDDKEAEAIHSLSTADSIYEAEKLIREKANVSEYKMLLEIMNHQKQNFYTFTEGMSDNLMKSELIKVAHDTPDEIMRLFNNQFSTKKFAVELIQKGIIERDTSGYYDGNDFIADSFEEVVTFLANQRNNDKVQKFGRLLNKESLVE